MASVGKQIANITILGAVSYYVGKNSIFNIEPGSMGLIFSRYSGLRETPLKEGIHFKLPLLEWPIIYDVRPKQWIGQTISANQDLQVSQVFVKVVYRPDPNNLSALHTLLGENYAQSVVPVLIQDAAKKIVSQFTSSQLVSGKTDLGYKIKQLLEEKTRNYHIIIDDVTIPSVTLGKEYKDSIETYALDNGQLLRKASFLVEYSKEEKASEDKIRAAQALGMMLSENPRIHLISSANSRLDLPKPKDNSIDSPVSPKANP